MRTTYSKFHKSQGFFWYIEDYVGEVSTRDIKGPFCTSCKMEILFPKKAFITETHPEYGEVEVFDDNYTGPTFCSVCKRKHILGASLEDAREQVVLDYVLKKRASIPVESLDELPSQIKLRDEDDKYFLAVKISEKDGKRIGVVYFGEKNKEQSKKDYSQVFVDLDDELIRPDKSNKLPREILAKLKIEFPKSTHEETYDTRGGAGKTKEPSTSTKRGTRKD